MGRASKRKKLESSVESDEKSEQNENASGRSSNDSPNKKVEYIIEDIWHVKPVRKSKNEYEMEFQVKWDEWSDLQNVSKSKIAFLFSITL